MIGVCQKTRRIFTKQTFEDRKLSRAGQDGNREWVTVLGAICADGTSLSPALIYKAITGDIQDDWLSDFDPTQHSCYFASTANGWTSDEHGLGWLEQVFQPETKDKAGRSWRLLFVDGHGSHLNMTFIERCHEFKILLAVYPPHSTHRLQPLNVSCFNPLANYYSQGLNKLISNSAGHTSIKKSDFFPIFWEAYHRAFTEKVVSSAWTKAGIWPYDPQIVLDGLPTRPTTPTKLPTGQHQGSSSPPSGLETPTRDIKIRTFVNRASAKADRRTSKALKFMSDQYGKISAELVLEKLENKNLKEALARDKRRKKRKMKVLEQLRSEGQTATLFMSPSKVQRARDILACREQEELERQDTRVARKEAVARKKADKEFELEQRRVARASAADARQAAAAERRLQS